MLGLGDRAGCGEGGGVRGGEGGWMKATSWMARNIITCYQLLRRIYYSVWPISIVRRAFERAGRGTKGVGGAEGGDELELRHGWLDG